MSPLQWGMLILKEVKLEFCVMLDFYINETADLAADYLLPTRTPLENSNLPIFLSNYQVFPHLEYSAAVVRPDKHGPKAEWEILLSLARLMDVPMFGNRFLNLIPKIFKIFRKKFTPEFFIKVFLFVGQLLKGKIPGISSKNYTLKQLKNKGTISLGNNEYGMLSDYIYTDSKKIEIFPSIIQNQILKCRNDYSHKLDFINEITESKNEFVMIGRRNLKTMNSWMHNIKKLWPNKKEPAVFINPIDARNLNLRNSEKVILKNELGEIKVPMLITEKIIKNVICYPHGWGHKNLHLSFASKHAGKNINLLTNNKEMNPLYGQPLMNGYRVSLFKA
ncbi:MAG: molybdopterin dinucleotide binding domain-containing protein [Promethearchaeia archaeon]